MNDAIGPGKRILYGRRRGKALRKTQKHLVETLLPQIRVPINDGEISTADMFAGTPVNRYWLEIGFGAGEHLSWQAAQNPDTGIIGCEPFINGVARLLGAIEARNLDNIRIHDDAAEKLLEKLPAAAIDRAFLLFADPWPKKAHHKRRFIRPENISALARILKDGAELRIGTDHTDYGGWMLWHMQQSADFEWIAESAADWDRRPADWPATRYEQKAVREGRKSVYYRFIRKNRP